MIETLSPNEIFVFGSNLAGIHGAGAAKQAFERFGAEWFCGYGERGQSFAIPTKDVRIETMPLEAIKPYVDGFLLHASKNTDKKYLVTKIGCGLAGYTPIQIAPMFSDVPSNVILPDEFKEILK